MTQAIIIQARTFKSEEEEMLEKVWFDCRLIMCVREHRTGKEREGSYVKVE